MWRRAVAASFGVLGFIGPVIADDGGPAVGTSPAPASQISWAGFYVGVSGGYGSSVRAPALHVDVTGEGSQSLAGSSMSAAVGGVQAGYNWHGLLDAGLVLGIEGDLEYQKMDGVLTTSGLSGVEARTSLNAFGTLRSRIGYAWEQVLLYATAGLAFGDIENTVLYKDSLGQTFAVDSAATKIGYTAGGGLGLILNQNWSLKLEYQFLHLEGFSASGTLGDGSNDAVRTRDFGHDYQIIKAGLDYHVGGSSQSLK